MTLDLTTLNPPQREAVETTEGPVLVLAGAGSGKTRVIVFRIAHLMEKGVSPRHILAVTFTNKAAGEMRERVADIVGAKRAKALTVCTFHAFGLQVLREEIHRLGYPRKFAIIDTGDQQALVRRVLKDVNDRGRNFDVKRIVSLISRAKMAGGRIRSLAGVDPEYQEIAAAVFDRYQKALFNLACVDFDDLIGLPIKLWKKDEELLEKYRDRFRYLLIDEYQDTNGTQFEMVKLLAGPRMNICAVGDDDQSIYGWRGAEVEHILKFEKQFPGTREIRLEQNYRSTGHILNAANAVIAKNSARKSKRLWTDKGSGEPISFVASHTEEDEAQFVADEILRLHHETKRPLSHFAILYRTNTQARALEEALVTTKLRYHVHGGLKFFDRKEVRDVIAYLRSCHNEQDDVSVSRIVNTPARGIGEATMERLHERARAEGVHLFSVMKRVDQLEDLQPTCVQAVQRFVELMQKYMGMIDADGWSKAARALCEEIDMAAECRKNVDSPQAAQRKIENLESLMRGLEQFEANNQGKGIAGYLARLSLDSRDEEPDGDGEDQITLMTLHSAKGLEFPIVFLAGVEEDLLPHSGMQGEAPNPDEERRLAYVGITRAREKLYMTRACHRFKNGALRPRTPSRFLGDIPDEHVERLDLVSNRAPRAEPQMQKGRDFFAQMRALGASVAVAQDGAPKEEGKGSGAGDRKASDG